MAKKNEKGATDADGDGVTMFSLYLVALLVLPTRTTDRSDTYFNGSNVTPTLPSAASAHSQTQGK